MQQQFPKSAYVLQAFKLVLCAALLLGPQVLLQLTAWSYMLVNYTQQSSLQTAVADTFSGQRPCELCQMIDAIEQEQETPTTTSRTAEDFRLLIPQLTRIALPAPPHQEFSYPQAIRELQSWHGPVPAPPPKQIS